MKDNTEEKLISVIVAAYNIETYLPRCLDSLAAQSYRNLEIIVVDDGSFDGTGEICDQYAKEDSRIKVIHQKNQGLSGARNAGLAAARGDYIGYVDGDDWVEPDMYQAMLRACEEEKAQMAVCAYQKIRAEEVHDQFTQKKYVLTKEEALDIYICDNRSYHIYNSVWSKLFRKDLVEGILFPIGKKSEDIMYTTKALTRTNVCVFLDIPYYNYVVDREDSIMNNKLHERRFGDEIPFWKEQIVYLKEQGFGELSEKAYYYFYRRMLFYFIEFKDKKMKASAREMVKLLKSERKNIKRVYQKNFAAVGDIVRIRIFLCSPGLFYCLVKMYERYVIPLRQ